MDTVGLRVENYLSVAVDLSSASDEYFSTLKIVSDGLGLWFYLADEDACVCVPHKNGGQAFREKLCTLRHWDIPRTVVGIMIQLKELGHGPFTAREIAALYPDKRHYLSIRNPVSRFASLWRNKCRDGNSAMDSIVGMTPDELMDHIENYSEADMHWLKQSVYLTSTTICVPYRKLFNYLGWEYESKNSTVSNGEDMPIDRILEFYADDYLLWEEACCTPIAV